MGLGYDPQSRIVSPHPMRVKVGRPAALAGGQQLKDSPADGIAEDVECGPPDLQEPR